MLLGLAAIADHLVVILYTEKWAACIPFMQVFCVSECFTILNTANLQALRGMGEVNTLLKLEFYKKPIMVMILIITMFISPLAIAFGMCMYGVYTMFVNAFPNRRFIHYHIKEQLKDVSENVAIALAMALVVNLVGRINMNVYFLVCVQVLVGVFIYMSLSYMFQIESWVYIKEETLKYFQKR